MSESQLPVAVDAEAEQSQEQAIQAIYSYANQLMDQGQSDDAIEQNLVERGLEQKMAENVVYEMREARRHHATTEGKKNMLYGALWCIGGTVVTVATYSAVANGGGRYVVAWGAILFGAIQFFRGVGQMMKR